MQNQELCILLESILALLETGNVDRAKEILQNAINRMDKGSTTSTKEQQLTLRSVGSVSESLPLIYRYKREPGELGGG